MVRSYLTTKRLIWGLALLFILVVFHAPLGRALWWINGAFLFFASISAN